MYEDVSEKIQLESRYNELIGVQRETIDNLHEGLALFGTDGCLKLFNPTFSRFWQLDETFLDNRPHVVEVFQHCARLMPDPQMWMEVKLAVTSLVRQPPPPAGPADPARRHGAGLQCGAAA